MLQEEPLTKEQQDFAAAHHNLVYKFLNINHLPKKDYYDVVIFPYLNAVRDYCNNPISQKYSFSTVAFRQMRLQLYNYFRSQSHKKRNVKIISIHSKSCIDGITMSERIPYQDVLMQQLEMQLLLHDLAGRISKQQMDIVCSKIYGYDNREIAHRQQISMVRIKELLEEVRVILMQLCYE